METTNLREKVIFSNKNLYVGMDVHEKSWNVSIFLEDMFIRSFTQQPSVEALEVLLKKDYPGANVTLRPRASFSNEI